MTRDIRGTELYVEAEGLYTAVRQPGTGQISDAAEVHASPDGRYAVFSGAILDTLHGAPATRICRTDLVASDTRVLTFGPNTDRLPKYSPDGRHIAFLSDRRKSGDFQLYLLDAACGAARAGAPVETGWVEYFHWSPDGKRILLGIAGHGADIAGTQGAISAKHIAEELPPWMPRVETRDEAFRWRWICIYDPVTSTVRRVSDPRLNIWEAVWCGNDLIAAVASPGPGEGLWYRAQLHLIDAVSGESRDLYSPRDQLGWPSGSPSGKHLAIVEAVCSDRWVVAGSLLVIETTSGTIQRIDTRDVDITFTEWRSDRALLLTGHRGFDTVVGVYDLARGTFEETWSGRELTISGRYASVAGLKEPGNCALLGEGFDRAPELAILQDGRYKVVRSFDLGCRQPPTTIDRIECVTWQAPDGLSIQGWVLTPKCEQPHPLILNVHGGPVSLSRPVWLGRAGAALLMLLSRGYAIFLPNPRGSSGRGLEFARRVVGDLGGLETADHLSGLDELVRRRVADPKRLGVTGVSHGGFMTSWLIGQDTRFAAAVPVAPITNWVSEHLVSNISEFCAISLADRYTNASGKYFRRSPIMHAHKVKTPTMNICGGIDRCTPPEEAIQFHNALIENGVESVLVSYPEEGHGVRKFPALIDYAARVVAWFEEHIPSRGIP